MFNSLKYVKILEEVGLTREQAETHIFIMTEVIETNLATREDMKDLRQDMKALATELRQEMKDLKTELRQEMQDLKTELRQEMQDLKTELRYEMSKMEYRLTIKLGTIVSVALSIAVAIIKLT